MKLLRKFQWDRTTNAIRLSVPKFWRDRFQTRYCVIEVHDKFLIVKPYFFQEDDISI